MKAAPTISAGAIGPAMVDALVPELARCCRLSAQAADGSSVAAIIAERLAEWSPAEAALVAVMVYRELCGDAPLHDLKPGVLNFYRALREECLP